MHQDIKPNDASKVDHQYHQISDLWTVLPSSSSPSSSSSSFIIIIIILKESIDPLVSFSNQSYPSNMVEKKWSLPNFSSPLWSAPGRWLDHLCHVHHLELVLDRSLHALERSHDFSSSVSVSGSPKASKGQQQVVRTHTHVYKLHYDIER